MGFKPATSRSALRLRDTAIHTARPGIRERHYRIEWLEPRRLLVASIVGTGGDDTFIISVNGDNSISLLFNGQPETINAPGDGLATVDAFEGNDTIILLNTGNIFWDLLGRSGDDSYTVGNGNLQADILRDVDILDSGATAGSNSIVINDANGGGTTYALDGLLLDILSIGLPTIQLGSGAPDDHITIQGGTGDDTLFVDQLPPRMIFDLGGGDDTVKLGGSQSIVNPALPTDSTLVGGIGQDTLDVDDSNLSSPRTSIRFNDNGLIGGPTIQDFNNLHIRTHVLPGNQPEPVTFRGNACITPFVSVIGGAGPDLVQVGEPGNGVFARLYLEHMVLDLGTGDNRLEINEMPSLSGNNWRIADNELTNDSGGTTSFSTTGLHLLQVFLNGTQHDDTYTVVDTPDLWSFEIDGLGGDDRLQMGGVLDLDDAFDTIVFTFIGGAGEDTIDISDIADEVGDADDYKIGEFISKGDFNTPLNTGILRHSFVDNLVMHLDHDPNRVFFDLSRFTTVQIFGNNGNDTFFNTDENLFADKQFFSTFADNVTLHGGAGADILSLDDSDATSAGLYAVDSTFVTYSFGSEVQNVSFSSMSVVEIACSGLDDIAQVRSKPSGATLNFNSGDGDDTVIAGGGDLVDSGLMSTSVTLLGGSGIDEIVFDDSLDDVGNYTFDNFTLSEGTSVITYGGFDTQTLAVANAIPPGAVANVIVNINAVSGFITNTTIESGPDRSSTVNLTQGNLANIGGDLTLNLSGAADRVNINDQNATGIIDYTFDADRFERLPGLAMNFTGAELMALNAGAGDSNFAVRGTPVGMFLSVNAGAGSDILLIGNGNISADLQGQVVMNGGPLSEVDVDSAIITNDNDTDPTPQTLVATSFTDGLTHSFIFIDSIRVIQGEVGSDLDVHSTIVPTTVDGGTGNDHVRVGNGNYSANIAAQLTFNGGSGQDSIIYDDAASTGNDSYLFANGNAFDKAAPAATTFTNSVELKTLEAGSGNNLIDIDAGSQDLHIHANDGNDTVRIAHMVTGAVTVNTGSENPAVAPFGDSLLVNDDFDGPPLTTIIDQDDIIRALSVFSGGLLRILPGAALKFTTFNMSGTIDVGGALISTQNFTTQLRTFLARGYNNGAWNGAHALGAINSSLAAGSILGDGVGYARGSQTAMTSIGSLSLAETDILLRYTLNGDAQLNQNVNALDFNALASSFGATPASWVQGDFNYDNAVSTADFNLLAGNFNQSLPVAAAITSSPNFSTINSPQRPFDATQAAQPNPKGRLALEIFSDDAVMGLL